MQQEASKALNFSTQKTMRLAQQLYEGVDVKGHGTVGLITYLRTDSTRVAEEAEKMAGEFIAENYGEAYLSTGENSKKNNGKDPGCARGDPSDESFSDTCQGEGISFERSVPSLPADLEAVYRRMPDVAAVYETTSVKIMAGRK